eukprot:154842-Prymnesium_polylepis.1
MVEGMVDLDALSRLLRPHPAAPDAAVGKRTPRRQGHGAAQQRRNHAAAPQRRSAAALQRCSAAVPQRTASWTRRTPGAAAAASHTI